MIFGYGRISTSSQNLESQVDMLLTYGVEKENIYVDIDSGAKNDRKQLEFLLKILRKGDMVVFYDLSRVGRDVRHLMNIVELFHLQGIDFKDLTVPMLDTKYIQTASGELIFLIFGIVAQFSRKLSNEKVQVGVDYARSQGRFGGRPKGISDRLKKVAPAVVLMHKNPETSIKDIKEMFGLSQGSVYACFRHEGYNYHKQHKNKGNKNAAYKVAQ